MSVTRQNRLCLQGGVRMRPYRGVLVASFVLLAALPLAGCSNPLDGGSGPSGSVIRVLSVTPLSIDLNVYSATSTHVTVALTNESRPNSPTATNSFVTMGRYRVDFTGLNKTVSIPTIDGAGQSVGIAADGTASMDVIVVDPPTLDYIRNHYPTIGYGESLTLRATITMWGEDAFKVLVSAQAQVTIVLS